MFQCSFCYAFSVFQPTKWVMISMTPHSLNVGNTFKDPASLQSCWRLPGFSRLTSDLLRSHPLPWQERTIKLVEEEEENVEEVDNKYKMKCERVCVCRRQIWRRILGQGGLEGKGWDSKTPDRPGRPGSPSRAPSVFHKFVRVQCTVTHVSHSANVVQCNLISIA